MKTLFILASVAAVLFVVPFVHGQETPAVLKPNQLMTFSLARGQEKVFVLQMKKGDFADIQSLAREGLDFRLELYDSSRKELLDQSRLGIDVPILFVAPADGNFILVSKLAEFQYPVLKISGGQRISIQYNTELRLPPGTNLKGIRKVNGFDVKIMTIDDIGNSVLLIEKNGQLQKVTKFAYSNSVPPDFGDYITEAYPSSAKEKRSVQLIKTTVDKTGDGIPDILVFVGSCGVNGRNCSTTTYFIDLEDTIRISEPYGDLAAIGKNPKGGLIFELKHSVYFGSSVVILEFRNGILRPNIELMKKPPPSLAVLKSKAQKFRPQLSLKPYKGIDNEDSVLYKEGFDYDSFFTDVMLDLIFSGNEDLAWQFLDLVWPPQKQGKALFIRDFKKQLLESQYWQMILEDNKK